MNGNEGKLINLLKSYFEQQWKKQYGTTNEWFLVFVEGYKNGEKHHLYESIITRTAEYGNKFMKDCPILSIVLQILFEGIDDDCLQTTSVFNDLWFTITTKGITSLTNNNKQSSMKCFEYTIEDVINKQLNNKDSVLFQALRVYYDKPLSSLFEQSKVHVNNDVKNMALNAIVSDGLLKGVEVVEAGTTPNLYRKLFGNVTTYLKKQEEQYLSERQITNVSPETQPFSSYAISKGDKEENDSLNKFMNELKPLLVKYGVDVNEFNFNEVSQQLFQKDMSGLEQIKDNMPNAKNKFVQFQTEFMEKFKEILNASDSLLSIVTNDHFLEFKFEITKLFVSEKIQLDSPELESILQKLYDNKEQNITKILEDITSIKKIKQFIIKIQSNEKLKSIWRSNMLIFDSIKRILEKYIQSTNNSDEMYTIISELYVNADNGMKSIEAKCTKLNEIKLEFYNDAEIRSKVFGENNVIISMESGINNENQISVSYTIDMVNENDQREKLETIKSLQKIMLGTHGDYTDGLFTDILPVDYNAFKKAIEDQQNSNTNTSLLDVMMPCILSKLKTGIDLSEICELDIFWNDSSKLYGMDYKTIFVCMIERYQHHQLIITSLIKKLAVALPFAYQWIIENKLIWKIPLRAYAYCLSIDCPIVVSLGSDLIGKSTLLNKIYNAGFVTNKDGIINSGIDVLFSTPEFSCGFTIFDVHGHVCKQKDLVDTFFKMIPLENCWILLQSISVNELTEINAALKHYNVDDNHIIYIMRDYKDTKKQITEERIVKQEDKVLSIRKIEENNAAFNASLATLREKIFNLTGIGDKSRKPMGKELRKETFNVYLEMEKKISTERHENICIDIQDQSISEFSTLTDELLSTIDTNKRNLQAQLFQHIEFNKMIQAEEDKKVQLKGKSMEQKQSELTTIDQNILKLSKQKAATIPSELMRQYNKLFLQKKFIFIDELEKRINAWQNPLLTPLFKERNNIIKRLEACRTSIAEIQTKNKGIPILQRQKTIEHDLEHEKKQISELIDNQTINRDIFMRELLAIYGDNEFLTKINSNKNTRELHFNSNLYITSFVEYMIKGNEIEIIDGDNNSFNYDIVLQIFQGLESKRTQSRDEPPFVVSVIGPQSTGKSTLLNMLFGSNFQTSAGRCTKGLYASIFSTEYPKAKTLLVLDTEGLLSIEKANEEYDKKLTLFSMACSQMMLVNLNGEINSAMKKILSISLFVANQLKVFKTRPIIIFVLRNMMDLNINKQREMIDNIKKELNDVAQICKIRLNEVLDFKEEKAFFLMLSAFNKDYVYNKGKELFQKSTTNAKFAKLSHDLRRQIFSEADTPEPKFKSLADWAKQASEIWKTIDMYSDIIMIESIKEINERKELSDVITKIMEIYIEPNAEKTSFRSKLDIILVEQETLTNTASSTLDDIEQRFDNEMVKCKENVLQYFDNTVKAKSYSVKLTNEYKDRLLSAIKTSKAQALQKYKALAEKRKIKNKTEAALIELQNRSEIKILEWQHVQQNISNEQKHEAKQRIIDDFKKYMNNVVKDTVEEMNKSKKTRVQWEDFVLQQITSAVGTIPVEKRFFSTTELERKSTKTTSCYNIIRLINKECGGDYENQLLEKILILVQMKQSYVSSISKKASTNAMDVGYVTENEVYVEKQQSFIVQKWNRATAWISNIFLPAAHTRRKTNKNTSNHSYQQHNNHREARIQNKYIAKLHEAGLDPEAIVFIFSMLHEMNDYLQGSIKTEIDESAEYQITCLKQNILQIEAKMSELNQKCLQEEEFEFTPAFGNELIEWLYEIIVEKMFKDEEETYKKIKEDFEKDVDSLLQDLINRLDSAFGDAENAKDMATKIFKNFENMILSKMEIEYKRDLREATYLNADKLVTLSDEVFYQKNGRFDQDGIYEYITNMIDYMKKIYSKYFDQKAIELNQTYNQKYPTIYQQQYENLMNKVVQLDRIFISYSYNPTHHDSHAAYFRKFFKAYLEEDIQESLIDIYLTKALKLTYYHSNPGLLEPSKLFHLVSIATYPITNPKIFSTSFKNTIELLHKSTQQNMRELKLSDDTKREQDKIKSENQQKALGCIEQCPYCGCKCTEITENHDAHHSDKHRLMAFKGSFEKLQNGKNAFVFDLCNSENTIRYSRWKENSTDQLSVRDSPLIRERMNEYSVGEGDVTITLAWSDSNDLDLHVTCPCGTDLYYGNKKCPICNGYLDLDMNVCCHGNSCPERKCSATKPAENVYFRPAKKGFYKVSVKYFSGPKGTAGTSSNFLVRIQTHANNYIQTFEGCVEASGNKTYVKVGDYEHSDASLNFLEHVKKNFNSWSNIRPINDKKWEIVLKKAWCQVAQKMSKFYGYENNTPLQFASLQYE